MTGSEHDDRAAPEPRVEREETHDGRYVLYFSWPDERSMEEDADAAPVADE